MTDYPDMRFNWEDVVLMLLIVFLAILMLVK